MHIVWEDNRLDWFYHEFRNAAIKQLNSELPADADYEDCCGSGYTRVLSYTPSGIGMSYKLSIEHLWMTFQIGDDGEVYASSNLQGFNNPPIKEIDETPM